MENVSQQNREEIIKLQGKIDLINQEVKQIKTNHLVHLESKINDIKKNTMVHCCCCSFQCSRSH